MTPELDKVLVEKYPKIFKDRYGNMQQTAMCWGFETGDGWYQLIDRLCRSIQSHIDSNPHLNISQVVAVQVKEKFATLRFYIRGGNEYINGMIAFAEAMSAKICERCGNHGKTLDDGGWYKTRCEQHEKE